MAFQLALRNNLQHPFSSTKKKAGEKWLRLFLKRHENLSYQKPQALSRARILGFTRENIEAFFSILKTELEKINFNPHNIYNVDETGITTVQDKSRKIITQKGRKQVLKPSSAERGALVTVVTCLSAEGQFVPPFLVLPRKNMKIELLDGAPPGTIAACHPSGWIQMDIFTKWLNHFVSIVKPSKQDPVVLILDGHYSHTRNIDVVDIARENGVSIVCLPPHSTDKLQPLDVAFMFPLKTYYAQEIENWLAAHPGRIITHYQIASILGKAYLRAATMETAINGFKKTGIFPFDPNVFNDADFVAKENEARDADINDPIALPPSPPTPSSLILPAQISPVPVVRPSSTSGRRGTAALISGSPYKENLMRAQEKNVSKRQPKDKIKKKKNTKATTSKRKRISSLSDDSFGTMSLVDTDDAESDDNDASCNYCHRYFSDKKGEKWIRCTKCFQWSHEKCAGAHSSTFICSFCLSK